VNAKIAYNESLAQKWIAAFNEHNIEHLLELYHEEAVHFSPRLLATQPETKGQISGHPAFRSWWQGAFDRMPTLHYQLQTLIVNEDKIFMEYVRSTAGETDLLVGEVLELAGEKIYRSRVLKY
jgi:ketosteroid isomerase-like protein